MIPPDLLLAVSAEGGGQLSIVIGAGCSLQAPTAIPLAKNLSLEAHRRLVKDGVLDADECANPEDLAALATLVFTKTGSQESLVRRLPIDRLRMARPNDGYKLLVAMMAEGVISHVLSLNFDLAIENAASELGFILSVSSHHGQLIPVHAALVHLHGSVNNVSNELVLRQETIDNDWKASWQQVVAQQVLAAPNILFAGLGSAAPVLSETVEMIRIALGGQKAFYQADVNAHGVNYFAQHLNVAANHYIQTDWCDAMRRLSNRVVDEQVESLLSNGSALLNANGFDDEEVEEFKDVASRLKAVSLVALGKFRARARLTGVSSYVPRSLADEEWMAMPLLTLAKVCKKTGLGPSAVQNGLWLLNENGRIKATILVATGKGTRKLGALESAIKDMCREIGESSVAPPDVVLVGGVVPDVAPTNAAAPLDIVEGDEAGDIISGPQTPLVVIAESAAAVTQMEEWLHD